MLFEGHKEQGSEPWGLTHQTPVSRESSDSGSQGTQDAIHCKMQLSQEKEHCQLNYEHAINWKTPLGSRTLKCKSMYVLDVMRQEGNV